jgi:hypothetical protein
MPDYYSTNHWMTTCGSDAGATAFEVLEFGFAATGLRIVNTCADPLYFTLTTDPASTNGASLAGSGGTFQAGKGSLFTPGISLATTSTSTGVSLPLGRPKVSVLAWSA